MSSHFEDMMRDLLDRTRRVAVVIFRAPPTDSVQRSGYPDLRIVDVASKRVFYLRSESSTPTGSRESSFRTFYFEPKSRDEQGAGRCGASRGRV